jgi:hypothetical protein
VGWRISFGIGPFRYSAPITSSRQQAARSRASAQAQAHMEQAAAELRAATAEMRVAQAEAHLASLIPPGYGQYSYYSVTAVRRDSIDLVSDDGRRFDGVEMAPQHAAQVEVGGRLTLDGTTFVNYAPPRHLAEFRRLVTETNSLPSSARASMRRQAATEEGARQFGYVFDEHDRLIPVQRSMRP